MAIQRACAACRKVRTLAIEAHGWLCKPCFRVQKYAKTNNHKTARRAEPRRKGR